MKKDEEDEDGRRRKTKKKSVLSGLDRTTCRFAHALKAEPRFKKTADRSAEKMGQSEAAH